MIDFIKRLFRASSVQTSSTSPRFHESIGPTPEQTLKQEPFIPVSHPMVSGRAVLDEYFRLSGAIESAKSEGNFSAAIRAARDTFPLMPAVVVQMKEEYGAFDISTSHAIHTGGTLMAVMEDSVGIKQLRETLSSTADLRRWLGSADQAEADIKLVARILELIGNNPGIKQTDLRRSIEGEGRRIGILISWLEKGKRIRRVNRPPTYALFAGPPLDETESPQMTEANNRGKESSIQLLRKRPNRSAAQAAKLDVTTLSYIRLPKAPMSWEEQARQNELAKRALTNSADKAGLTQVRFDVFGEGWRIRKEEKLSLKDRPNSAYRQMFPTNGSTTWLDAKGRREDFPTARTVLMTTNRNGDKIAERGIPLDVYRSDVNGDGSGILFMSSEGVLHAYSEGLDTLFIEQVALLPEYAAQAARFGIPETQLRNHTRCVALSSDKTRFLVTIVDEAWCYDASSGMPIWGLRFPTKEGWTEVVSERSERVGVSAEISAALQLMELKLPVSPEEIARQYRAMAKKWHPDKNQQHPEFNRRFQELGAAMELLTGMDLSALSRVEIETSTYQKMLHRITVPVGDGQTVTVTMSLQFGGAFGADWIYASNFAHEGHNVFLAGYSGRVVEVDPRGRPVRVYDIGTVPKQISETSKNLYILTATRFYVLQGDKLQALVDVFDQGRLVVADKGFGLVQAKSLRWFTPDGVELGEVQSKDPIRRIFFGSEGLVVETRSHRALIEGAPSWW
jgi:DnaJ domain